MTSETYRSCPTVGVPWLVGDSPNMHKRVIVKARCKQWDCPYCAAINKYEHYNRIANGVNRLWKKRIPMTFTTITCHEKWRGKNASIRNWRTNRGKLLDRYRRANKRACCSTCEYVYIPELHEDETIHIHGIFTGELNTRWWKDNARQSGLGYMAESAKLESVLQAVNYITKYMVKEMGKTQYIKGFRRVNYSQGFPPEAKHKSIFDWSLLDGETSIEDAILEGLLRENYDVYLDGNQVTLDDFLD